MDMNKHISNNMPVVKISLEIFVGLCLYCGLSSEALHMMGSTDDHHEGKDEADVDDGRRNPHLDLCLKLPSFFKQCLTDAFTKSAKSQGLISALPPASYLCSN